MDEDEYILPGAEAVDRQTRIECMRMAVTCETAEDPVQLAWRIAHFVEYGKIAMVRGDDDGPVDDLPFGDDDDESDGDRRH